MQVSLQRFFVDVERDIFSLEDLADTAGPRLKTVAGQEQEDDGQ